MTYVVFAARLVIGGLFVYASVHKIADPADFSIAIRNYMIIPAAWSNFVALTLPWIEITAGLFLLVGIMTRPSALLTTVMLGVFLAAIIYAFSVGLDIDCGCFTSSSASAGKVGLNLIARDAGLFLVSLLILVGDRGALSLASVFRRRCPVRS